MFKLPIVAIFGCLVYLSVAQNVETEIDADTNKINQAAQNITEIDPDYSAFSELVEVDFSNNDITYINPNAFANNTKLRRIDLSGNKNLQLPATDIFLWSNVLELNISDCNIESIPGTALNGMHNLDMLDVSNNPINFELSLAFQMMTHPPSTLIISKISEVDLKYICQKMEMKVLIKDENKEIDCKNIRDLKIKIEKVLDSKDTDLDMQEVEETANSNSMEMMMNDEGSGNEPINENLDTTTNQNENIDSVNTEKTADNEDNKELTKEETTSKLEEDEVNKVADEDDKDNVTEEVTVAATESQTVNAPIEEIIPKSENIAHVENNESKIQEINNKETAIKESLDKLEIVSEIENVETDAERTVSIGGHTKENSDNNQRRVPINESDKTHEENKIEMGESTEASSGSNVILILVIAAVVVGSVIVGWKKFGKRRQHQEIPVKEEEMQVMSRKPDAPTGDEAKPFIPKLTHENETSKENGAIVKKDDESNNEQNEIIIDEISKEEDDIKIAKENAQVKT